MLDDEAPDDAIEVRKSSKSKEKREKDYSTGRKDRHMRKRDYDEKEWESDEEEKARKRWKRDEEVEREEQEDEFMETEDESNKKEREREEDLRERDAFAERIRERDKERTKKVVEDHSSKVTGAAAEAAQRRQLAEDVEARTAALPSLRLHSRQEYLTKREIQQIELLRKEIADDEALFAGMNISRREKKELERKKELLRLVEERLKINDKWDGYQLPEDYITEQGKIDKKKKENVLYKRYEDAKPKDDQFTTDIDQWEAHQTQMSTFKTGAQDKKEIVDDYEYVFDESQTIKFVMESAALPGYGMSAADKLLQKQIEESEKRGQSVRFIEGDLESHVSYLQRKLLKRLERTYPYTSISKISLTPFESTKSSSSWLKLDQEKPHNFHSIFTKRVSQLTAKRLVVRNHVALLRCLLLLVWQRKWGQKSVMKSATPFVLKIVPVTRLFSNI